MDGVNGTRAVFSNGRLFLLAILMPAIIGITVLGALHDVDEQVLVGIYSAVISGAFAHANGNLQGRLAAEREHLIADAAEAKRQGQP